MRANLTRSLKQIFGHEGGFTKDRRDPGNWTGGRVGRGRLVGTKFGIAANSYPNLDIRNLTLADAEAIYRQDYAARIRYDELPAGVDHVTLDLAINSGVKRAALMLQETLGVEADGWIGPKTIAIALSRDWFLTIDALCDRRLGWLRSLKTWKTYGRGWTRRIKDVRAFGLALAKEQLT